MRRFLRQNLTLFIFLCCASLSWAQTHYTLEASLTKLDSLIEQTPAFEIQRNLNINSVRNQLVSTKTLEERYFVQSMLYSRFIGFNADSAIYYNKKNEEIARQTNNPEHYFETQLRKASIASSTGLLKEAIEILGNMESDKIPQSLKQRYYNENVFLYGHLQQSANGESLKSYYEKKRSLYLDSILQVIPKGDSSHLIYKGWAALVKGGEESVIKNLEDVVRKEEEKGEFSGAMNYYMLGRLYEKIGKQKKFALYMTLASIVDIQHANKDLAATEELASWLFKNGDNERGYTYMQYCVNCAESYHNQVRIISTQDKLKEMQMYFLEQTHRQDRNFLILGYGITILAILLAAAMSLFYWQLRKQQRNQRELIASHQKLDQKTRELTEMNKQLTEMNLQQTSANEKLSLLNEQFQLLNDKLKEANIVKEEYIGYTFTLCSDYIEAITTNRKTIGRKLVAGQYEEAKRMVDTSAVEQSLLKQFYYHFDTIFLNLYPDFVQEFNSLLREDEQIQVKNINELNTELRIYALVRLGISDTGKIAEFLRCNPHTIYNYRMKIRNKAKDNKEEFLEKVRLLGKIGS